MRVRTIVALAVVAVLPIPLSGCGAVKAAFNPKPKVNVVSREATVAVVGAPVNGKLAERMPEGVALWPESTVVGSHLTKTPQGASWSVQLATNDPYDDVIKGMGVGLEKAGWTVQAQDVGTAEAPSRILTLTRDGSDGLVTISVIESPTVTIDMMMTAAPK